jgi:hypothetical protein
VHAHRLLAARGDRRGGPGDTIRVPDLGGPYRLTFWDPGDPSGEPGHLKITKALTIRGPPTGATIQQTRPDARVFEVHGGGNLDLSNFTLTGGEAGNNSTAVPGHIHGGAIHNHGVVSLENVTITGNHARSTMLESVGGGGGFYNAGTASFTNVTIVGNDASVRAGGIAGNPVTLHNTLIADNTGANGNCQSAETNGGGNLEYAGATCGVPVAARAPIGPLPVGGVFELLPGSEAIDAGTGTAPPACPAIDELGGARPLDGDGDGAARCDTGAIEFDPTGIGVIHQPLDGSGGRGPATVTFDNVTTAGTTTLHVSGSGPAPPAGYRPVAYYDLSTTAVFTGGVRVCVDWSGHTVADESAVRLFRHAGGAWTDATVSLDTAANVVCGRAASLGIFAVLAANRPPTASVDEPAGGYAVTEGGAVTLQGRGTDPDGDALTYAWSPTADLSDPAAATPVLAPRDEGDRPLRLVVSDGESTSPPATVTVRVANAPPSVTVTSPAPGLAHRAGSPVAVAASFTDPGPDDVHTCTIAWDDGSAPEPGAVTESTGTCAGTHTFPRPGTYTVRVTVDDGDGGSDSASTLVVVHEPRPRLVAGGGALTSPPGAYRAQPAVAHVGLFAVTATYRPGATAPIGLTTFRLLATGLTFRSTAYDWLVISGARAQLRGAGRIGGSGSYGFLLTVADGGTSGDRLRMKIWDRTAGDRVVYDNVLDPAATDDLDTARPRPISAGGIAVQPGP